MGRGGEGVGRGREKTQPVIPIGGSSSCPPVTVNKQQLFKPYLLMPSVASIYLWRGWQGLPGAIKLFASSTFKSALPLAMESSVGYGQPSC